MDNVINGIYSVNEPSKKVMYLMTKITHSVILNVKYNYKRRIDFYVPKQKNFYSPNVTSVRCTSFFFLNGCIAFHKFEAMTSKIYIKFKIFRFKYTNNLAADIYTNLYFCECNTKRGY